MMLFRTRMYLLKALGDSCLSHGICIEIKTFFMHVLALTLVVVVMKLL